MQKILILGSTGMLGHQVVLRLTQNPGFQVFDLSFRNKFRDETIICDVTDFKKLGKVIEDIKPNFIVNCIGILIKGSNENPKNSILINSYLPHFLVGECDKIGAKVIHISTDCVFSGEKGGYVESDFRDADDIYGRGKALGEINTPRHLTLRTSIIGPELKKNGEGLFQWFCNQTGSINGYTNVFWGGVTTIELSKFIEQSLVQDLIGLIHVTNSRKISKYDMLNYFREFLDHDIVILPYNNYYVDKSLLTERNDYIYYFPSFEEMFYEMCMNYKDFY